jgi:hypothetical protein
MFDTSDSSTQKAILELFELRQNSKPVILWIGAGASCWAGCPTWNELAERMHSRFLKLESAYDSTSGLEALTTQALPTIFSLCKDVNKGRYLDMLSTELRVRDVTPVYARFISLLQQIDSLAILTTNIDESLEANLGAVQSFQRSNIEFANRALTARTPFVLKLHGTASAIENSVWTDEDYACIAADASFIEKLKQMLASATVVFIGYSLRDEYILNILRQNHSLATLLGDGPHFLISSSARVSDLPSQVKVIQYLKSSHSDHRSALAAIDLLRTVPKEISEMEIPEAVRPTSAIYLPDYFSFGTWTTSQTATFSDFDGKIVGRATVGTGFVQNELPSVITTSLHDLLVGLLCFDRIYFPINGSGKLYSDLGPNIFWQLIESDVFRFVWHTSDLAVVFSGVDSVKDGSIAHVGPRSKQNSSEDRTLAEVLFLQLPSEFVTEEKRQKLLDRFERITIKLDNSVLGGHPVLVQGSLLSPRLRASLGFSDAILPTKIPEWYVFSTLRVASVVRDAEVSRSLGAAAVKMPFGSDALANATFGLLPTKQTVSDHAGYVIGGRFRTDLGQLVVGRPDLWKKVIIFRETGTGEEFRKEVFNHLETNEGAEFVAAVNGALRSTIAIDLLERARETFATLHLSANCMPVISSQGDQADPFKLWRKRSSEILRTYCNAHNLKPYDVCPCGSGDKLKFCCGILFSQ